MRSLPCQNSTRHYGFFTWFSLNWDWNDWANNQSSWKPQTSSSPSSTTSDGVHISHSMCHKILVAASIDIPCGSQAESKYAPDCGPSRTPTTQSSCTNQFYRSLQQPPLLVTLHQAQIAIGSTYQVVEWLPCLDLNFPQFLHYLSWQEIFLQATTAEKALDFHKFIEWPRFTFPCSLMYFFFTCFRITSLLVVMYLHVLHCKPSSGLPSYSICCVGSSGSWIWLGLPFVDR